MLNSTLLDGEGKSTRNGAAVFEYMLATENYYLGEKDLGISSSHWIGNGSKALGLDGVVDIKDMRQVGFGFGPDGTELRQNAGSAKRMGWDLTFSAESSFSFAYSVASPEDKAALLETHHRAVEVGMAFLESHARVRTGKDGLGEQLKTKGLVVSRHTHFGSRELEPQVHSHCLTYNIAEGVDGQHRALHADYMLQNVRSAGALYRAEHAWQLRQMGHGIIKDRSLDADDREEGNVFYKLAGVDERLTDLISTRRKQILAHQEEHGGTLQQAAMATRKHKDEPSYPELVEMWEKSLGEALKADPTLKVPTIDDLKGLAHDFGEEITDEDILMRLHTNEASFTRSQLTERIALEHVGQKDAMACLEEVEAFLKRAKIVELTHHNDHKLPDGEPKYAAQWMVDMEIEIGARGRARMDDVLTKVAPETVEASLAKIEAKNGYKLTDEQVGVIVHQTVDTGGTCVVSGRAGTGKTTVSEVAVDAWQANGQTVIGVSTGWDAAKKLEAEAGIEAFSAAKLLWDLENGNLKLTNRHVVVFDEAGMAGTEVIHTLQGYTDKAKCKLVLVGDKHQLQPVSAGNPFATLINEVGHRELTEMRRQKHMKDRETAGMHYGKSGPTLGQQILERLDARGQVHRFEDRKGAIDQMAKGWIDSKTLDRDKLFMAGRKADVKILNEKIRDLRKQEGLLGQDEATFKAKADRAWHEMKVSTGDLIRFSAKDKDRSMNVVNGTYGVVEKIQPGMKPDSHRLTVRLDSPIAKDHGRLVEFDTAIFMSLAPGYAQTVHKAQGQGKKDVRFMVDGAMTDRHQALVAFTRTKEHFAMYGSKVDIEQAAPRMGQDRFKLNAIDQMPKAQTKVEEPGIKISEKGLAKLQSFKELLEARRELKKGKGIRISR